VQADAEVLGGAVVVSRQSVGESLGVHLGKTQNQSNAR
jgi:hypothetical protein